ncbi:MAG: methylmalonyl-CoA epimerase [Saprospiraceae bacterium]|nr:methylmalonyl-CoA epimerase [Saprospiraceae bacterium]
MLKIEHIGIAVKSMDQSNELFTSLLGRAPYKQEEAALDKVNTSFYDMNGTKIELVAATDESSPIAKFIGKKGEGIHHIAFEVKDILESMQLLRLLGFQLIDEVPRRGADNKMVCFLHPKSTNGVLVELCQSIVEENA